MTDKLTRKGRRSTLALIGVLAALGIGSVAIPAVAGAAAPAGQAGGNYHPSEWAPAGEFASSGKAPSLTNQVGKPDDGGGSQLWLGYALLGVGLLGLAGGLAARGSKPRGAPIAARSHPGTHSRRTPRQQPARVAEQVLRRSAQAECCPAADAAAGPSSGKTAAPASAEPRPGSREPQCTQRQTTSQGESMKGKLTQKVNIAVIAALGVLAVVGVGYASWPSSKKAAASASRQPDERGSACSNVIVEPRERVV